MQKTTIFVLATCWDNFRDESKLLELEKMQYKVFSVSDCISENQKHVTSNFKNKISKTIIVNADSEYADFFLDHAWLEINYYFERYGLKWLNEKATALFLAGASKLYLPRDSKGANELNTMIETFIQTKNSKIKISNIKDDLNPLFVAAMTTLQKITNLKERQRAQNAEMNYTQKNQRFVLVEPIL